MGGVGWEGGARAGRGGGNQTPHDVRELIRNSRACVLGPCGSGLGMQGGGG